MWDDLLDPGLALLSGRARVLRAFHHELVHHAARKGTVLFCDGNHGYDPYEFAETNLRNAQPADHLAERVLVRRAMTPFQWDSILREHLETKLQDTEAALVVASPFDRLFGTDELKDWEQEDHVRACLDDLRSKSERFEVPILLSVDLARWWQSHPVLAGMAYHRTRRRWHVERPAGVWQVREEQGRRLEAARPWVTLDDFLESTVPVAHQATRIQERRDPRPWPMHN